jgi:hypothetical protein
MHLHENVRLILVSGTDILQKAYQCHVRAQIIRYTGLLSCNSEQVITVYQPAPLDQLGIVAHPACKDEISCVGLTLFVDHQDNFKGKVSKENSCSGAIVGTYEANGSHEDIINCCNRHRI